MREPLPWHDGSGQGALQYIHIIKSDDQGRLWFASDGRGLTMFDGQYWYNWQPETRVDMKYDAIRSLAVSGNMVYAGGYTSRAGTTNLVMTFDVDQDQWSTLQKTNSELSGTIAWGIAVDKTGKTYFPMTSGVLDVLDGKGWKHIDMTPLPQHYPLDAEEALLDSSGNYWIATYGFGVWKYDGHIWTRYGGIPDEDLARPENGLLRLPSPSQDTDLRTIPSFALALAEDHEGRLWVASSKGVAVKYRDDTWTLYSNSELQLRDQRNPNLGDRWVYDIGIDSKGRVWAISMYRLLVFDGHAWQSFSPDVVGAQYWGDAIGFDIQGNAWVGLGGKDGGVAMFAERGVN